MAAVLLPAAAPFVQDVSVVLHAASPAAMHRVATVQLSCVQVLLNHVSYFR